MRGWGICLIIVGVIYAFLAVTMDTSVSTGLGGRVNNIGLMNDQTNMLIGAGVVFVSGILLVGFGSGFSPSYTSSDEMRTCPYCAEQIKAQARICRFCQKDLPVLNLDNIQDASINPSSSDIVSDDNSKESVGSTLGYIARVILYSYVSFRILSIILGAVVGGVAGSSVVDVHDAQVLGAEAGKEAVERFYILLLCISSAIGVWVASPKNKHEKINNPKT